MCVLCATRMVSMSFMSHQAFWKVCCQMQCQRQVFTEPKTQHLHTSILVLEWPFALWKTPIEPNETFTQWKIKKAPSQLACIKIPHRPSSFSQNLFFVVFVANFFPPVLVLTWDYRELLTGLGCFDQFCELSKSGLTCFVFLSLKCDYFECVIHKIIYLFMLGARLVLVCFLFISETTIEKLLM